MSKKPYEIAEELSHKLEKEVTTTQHGAFGENSPLFLEHLDSIKPGLTSATVADVEDAKTIFTAAMSLVNGRLGTKLLKENKSLDRTTMKFSVGRDEVTSTFLRRRESPNPQDRTKTIVTHGALSTNYTSVSGAGSKGALKQVKLTLAELAVKELAG